jgi:predicted dienelactone hydrolase
MLTLDDRRRDRRFLADIYLPRTRTKAPIIVISHGLGSDRTSFEYLAQHLASYGFAVAVPEHPGSSAEQVGALLAGRSYKVEQPTEFINRPLDVKYLLDQLQRLDNSEPSFQLNMQQVGVIGQSFGGYTALALAGATLNFGQLHKDCDNLNDSWNTSLLLQCQVLRLPRPQYTLHDSRVKAAIAINPLTSSVFGEASFSKIRVPVMIVSSGSDKVAPALPEQILPFTWLTTPEKYLAVIEGGTHFSTIGETDPTRDPFILPPQVIGPKPAIARRYMSALSVAFCQTYVAKVSQYRPYLSAAYAQKISQTPLNLSLVQSLSATQLTQPC